MRQSRSTSLLKSLISTGTGFGISLAAQWAILPVLLGAPVPLHANLSFAAIMTVISIARGYGLERFFEVMGWRVRLSPFVQAVIAERIRQVEIEGWSHEHDDDQVPGELAAAGAAYVKQAHRHFSGDLDGPPGFWPWAMTWWKPTNFRRDLVKGAALVVAEGEKFDRARRRKGAAQ